MAKQKHSGPNSAANPSQERAWLAGRAWLNGLTPAERDAALATAAAPAETPDAEKAAADASLLTAVVINRETGRAVATFMLTADAERFIKTMVQRTGKADLYEITDLPGTAGPSRAQTLLDVAREIRAWGSVGLFGAADRLEALAQELAADAPTADPLSFTHNTERLAIVMEAGCQIDGLANLIIDAGPDSDNRDALRSIAIRVRDLAGGVVFGLSDDGEDIDDLHLRVHGTKRATEGAAS